MPQQLEHNLDFLSYLHFCYNIRQYYQTHIALVLYTISTQIAIGNRKFPKKFSVIRRQYVYACKLLNFFTPQFRRT